MEIILHEMELYFGFITMECDRILMGAVPVLAMAMLPKKLACG
jgi:hypothetical protein